MDCHFPPSSPVWIVPTFRALHKHYQAEVCGADPTVENISSGWRYLGRKGNRAYVVGSYKAPWGDPVYKHHRIPMSKVRELRTDPDLNPLDI